MLNISHKRLNSETDAPKTYTITLGNELWKDTHTTQNGHEILKKSIFNQWDHK